MTGRGSTETATLYRCTTCGKWSHAQRQPRNHKRFIPDEGVTEDWPEVGGEIQGLRVLEVVPYEEWHEGSTPGGVWVACGPFDVWTAEKVAA